MKLLFVIFRNAAMLHKRQSCIELPPPHTNTKLRSIFLLSFSVSLSLCLSPSFCLSVCMSFSLLVRSFNSFVRSFERSLAHSLAVRHNNMALAAGLRRKLCKYATRISKFASRIDGFFAKRFRRTL